MWEEIKVTNREIEDSSNYGEKYYGTIILSDLEELKSFYVIKD